MNRPTMHTEPLRYPAWLSAIIVTFMPVVIAVLLEQDWRVALAAALAGLIPGAGVVAYAESRRAFTDSPATQERLTAEAWATFEANGWDTAEADAHPEV